MVRVHLIHEKDFARCALSDSGDPLTLFCSFAKPPMKSWKRFFSNSGEAAKKCKVSFALDRERWSGRREGVEDG